MHFVLFDVSVRSMVHTTSAAHCAHRARSADTESGGSDVTPWTRPGGAATNNWDPYFRGPRSGCMLSYRDAFHHSRNPWEHGQAPDAGAGVSGNNNAYTPFQWSHYSFFVATTICYTRLDKGTCELQEDTYAREPDENRDEFARNWLETAYTHPEKWKGAWTQFTGDGGQDAADARKDVSMCRRNWQYMELQVKYGGEVSIMPTVEMSSTMAVRHSDGTYTIPNDEDQWQKHSDQGAQRVDGESDVDSARLKDTGAASCNVNTISGKTTDCTLGSPFSGLATDTDGTATAALVDTAQDAAGQPQMFFGKRYLYEFEVATGKQDWGDKPMVDLIHEQYNNVEVKYRWERFVGDNQGLHVLITEPGP